MGRLSPHTINQYRWMLKRLRRILPLMPEDDPERPKVVAKIEKLTNQLGVELTDLETALTRGPGRPRTEPIVSEYEDALRAEGKANVKRATGEGRTFEEIQVETEAKRREKQAELREKIRATDPDAIAQREAEEASMKALRELEELATVTPTLAKSTKKEQAQAELQRNMAINAQAQKEAAEQDELVRKAQELKFGGDTSEGPKTTNQVEPAGGTPRSDS